MSAPIRHGFLLVVRIKRYYSVVMGIALQPANRCLQRDGARRFATWRLCLRSCCRPALLESPDSSSFLATSSGWTIAMRLKYSQTRIPCSVYGCLHCRLLHIPGPLLKKPQADADKPKTQRKLKFAPKFKKKIGHEKVVKVWKNMTVQQLAEGMDKDLDHMFEAMMFIENTNDYDKPNAELDDIKVIQHIVKLSGMRSAVVSPEVDVSEKEITVERAPPDPLSLVKRPPVVTIMGHVDHGKTTLLDTLRKSSIVSQEFGGITQHIGAFEVKVASGETITFLDTPGHAAFSAMRARGAYVTDIVVLVVAADDGVMEQTLESLKFAQAAKVPVIVAINKIDKPNADVEKCKKELLKNGIQLEDDGGDVQAVCISALKGTNVDTLVEAILTQAELMQVKGDPKGLVEGAIIESRLDASRGNLSTAVVQRGTLRKGAFLVADKAWAKVRSMFNEHGNIIQSAPPGTPVEIIGWKSLPSAGEKMLEVESEKKAKAIVEARHEKTMKERQTEDLKVIEQKMQEHAEQYRLDREVRLREGRYRRKFTPQKENEKDKGPQLLLVIKGDVDGSVDAILDVLETYHSPLCALDIIHFGVGPVTENDVELAAAFGGIVYGFNVSVMPEARRLARANSVHIKEVNIIYRLIDDLKEELNARLPTTNQEQILGEADVLQEFVVNEGKKKCPVAGCRCHKGILKKSAQFRLVRDGISLHEGSLVSMRHLKNEVDSIKKDVDCGLRFDNIDVRFQMGDVIQCFQLVEVKQTTDWDPGF